MPGLTLALVFRRMRSSLGQGLTRWLRRLPMFRLLDTARALALMVCLYPGVCPAVTLLSMQVGEVRVLAVPDVARVAVGDGHVLNAVTTEEKEVIVFARNEGSSALQIWSVDGVRHAYQIDVAPEGARQTQQELQQVLERIPNAQVSAVGDKLVVDGEDLSDGDRQRLAE